MDDSDINHPSVAFDLHSQYADLSFYSGFDYENEWKNSNGRVFKIEEMSCQHIENSLRSIYRENMQHKRLPSIKALHEERRKRVLNACWIPGRMIGKAPDSYFEQFGDFFQFVKENKDNGMIQYLDEIIV